LVDIRPFRGVHYSELVPDRAAVVCPPYDIITPEMRQELYRRSDYNFVRIEFTRALPDDVTPDEKYARSAAALQEWLAQGILEVDATPALYLHDQHFTYQGKEYRRRGITALVRLEEENGGVRPHEGTRTQPKDDRLKLLRTLQANTSAIFTLYEDESQRVVRLLAAQETSEPLLDVSVHGERHIVRAINDSHTIGEISGFLAGQSLYIADGHHRYESALKYMHERRAAPAPVSGEEPFNYVMITLVDFADPGLVIAPAHRLVRGLSAPVIEGLSDQLEGLFTLEKLPLSTPGVWPQLESMLQAEPEKVKLAIFGLAEDSLLVLTARDDIASRMPGTHSELYKKLDVSVVDHLILERILGLDIDKDEASLAYAYDRLDAVDSVLDGEYQLAFLLSPPRAVMVKALADAGERMPKKSTYFYPKLPVGLVFRLLRD